MASTGFTLFELLILNGKIPENLLEPDTKRFFNKALIKAAVYQQWQLVDKILSNFNHTNLSVSSNDEGGYTLLHHLIFGNQTELIKKYAAKLNPHRRSNNALSSFEFAFLHPEVLTATICETLKTYDSLPSKSDNQVFDVNRSLFLSIIQEPIIKKYRSKGKTLLYYMVIYGDADRIDLLLQRGANPYQLCDDGLTPFTAAALLNRWDIVLKLFNHHNPSPPDTMTQYADVSLIAAKHQQWAFVDKLLSSKHIEDGLILSVDGAGYTLIHYLIFYNQIELIQKHGAKFNPHAQSNNGLSSFEFAFLQPDVLIETIRKTLETYDALSDPDIQAFKVDKPLFLSLFTEFIVSKYREGGKTLLYYMMLYNHTERIDLLLQRGANPHQICDEGLTPLGKAVRLEYWDIVLKFFNHSPSTPGDREHYGEALLFAAKHQQWSLVDKLLSNKHIKTNYFIASGNGAGFTTLHFLVLYNQSQLIQKHAAKLNLHARNKKSLSAFELAFLNQDAPIETLNTILAAYDVLPSDSMTRNFDIDKPLFLPFDQKYVTENYRAKGKTLLYHMVLHGEMDKIALVLQSGANPHQLCDEGLTPLQKAIRLKRWDIVLKFFNHAPPTSGDSNSYGEALLFAAESQQWSLVDKLLSSSQIKTNWIISSGNKAGFTPLLFLVLHNQCGLIQKHAEKFNFNSQLKETYPTVLTLASECAQVTAETLNFLLQTVPTLLMSKSHCGQTPLMLAARENNLTKINALLKHGANPVAKHNHNVSVLGFLKSENNTDLYSYLFIEWKKTQKQKITEQELSGLMIQTTQHLHYVLSQVNTLKGLNCFLKTDVDVSGYHLSQLGQFKELTIKQYTNALLNLLDDSSPKPTLSITDLLYESQNLRISRLSNRDFILFAKKWLPRLYMAVQMQNTDIAVGIRQQLSNHMFACQSHINQYISKNALQSIISHLKIKLPVPEDRNLNYQSRFFRPFRLCTAARRITFSHSLGLQTIAKIMQLEAGENYHHQVYLNYLKASAYVFNHTKPTSQIYRLYLSIACMLIRVGYSNLELLPENICNLEVGSALAPIEDLPFEDLIITCSDENQLKIFNASEIVERLRKSDTFQDPKDLNLLNQREIQACLHHPKVIKGLEILHQEKSGENSHILQNRMINEFKKIVSVLKNLGETLWQASTDSNRLKFDGKTAGNAMTDFFGFINKQPKYIIDELNHQSYYLKTRNQKTSFSQLYSQATYGGCSGQLGIAIKEWITKFEKEMSTIAENAGKNITIFSVYLEQRPSDTPSTIKIPDEYALSGHILASSLSYTALAAP